MLFPTLIHQSSHVEFIERYIKRKSKEIEPTAEYKGSFKKHCFIKSIFHWFSINSHHLKNFKL